MLFTYRTIERACQIGILVYLFAVAQTSLALTSEDFRFSGFASLTYGKAISDSDEGDWYGITDEGEYRDLSVLGLRVDADLNNRVKFAAQAIARGNEDYDPEFDWIYASIGITNEISATVGKFRAPLFVYSDFLDVKYAYQWVQPPRPVYDVPFNSVEGIKFNYVTELGEWTSELIAFYGTAEDDFSDASSGFQTVLEGKLDLGLAWTVERDWLTLRFLMMDGSLGADVSTLVGGINQSAFNPLYQGILAYANNPALEAGLNAQQAGLGTAVKANLLSLASDFNSDMLQLQNDLQWEDSSARFYGFGTTLDFETVFFGFEATRVEIKEANLASAKDVDSAFLMIGTRIVKDWTFSITGTWDEDKEHSVLYEDFNAAIEPFVNYELAPGSGLPLDLISGLDPVTGLPIAGSNGTNDFIDMGYQAAADGFQDQIKSIQQWETKGMILTARWDFHRSAALKFEYVDEKRTRGNEEELNPKAFLISLDLIF